jgi:hypothetical protein
VVEHYLDTVGVRGSNPHAPTKLLQEVTPYNHVFRCSRTLQVRHIE